MLKGEIGPGGCLRSNELIPALVTSASHPTESEWISNSRILILPMMGMWGECTFFLALVKELQ